MANSLLHRTAVIVLTLAAVSACSLIPQRRSTEAFCSTLDDGIASMKETFTSADPNDTLGLLRATADSVGQLTRIIRKLDAVAPDAIAEDMHAVRELWDKQADLARDAADNPLGAVAGSVASAFMNAGSIKAVDVFARDHCSSQLAGTAG